MKAQTAKDKIYHSIRNDIICIKLKPGQSISEDELAKFYKVSRTPIREILRRLEQDELIKIVPNRGIYINELTNKDIEEVLDIRLILETVAAGVAARKITSEQIKELDKIEKLLEEAAQKADSVLSFEADERLHDLILVTADNARMRKIINILMGQILRIRFISRHKPGRIITTVEEHLDILRALKRHDSLEAEEKMKIHLQNTRELLLPPQNMDAVFEQIIKISNLVRV